MENRRRKMERICPLCGKIYCEAPAQSRRDKRNICPDCGTKESLEDSGLDAGTQKEILEEIRRCLDARGG